MIDLFNHRKSSALEIQQQKAQVSLKVERCLVLFSFNPKKKRREPYISIPHDVIPLKYTCAMSFTSLNDADILSRCI